MTTTPSNNKLQNQKEEKLFLQRSLNSELYNDRNSTDEDLKAPILGKNLNQFKDIMQSKHFEKQNIINSNIQNNSVKKSSSNISTFSL